MRHRTRSLSFFNRWDKLPRYLAIFLLTTLLVVQVLLFKESTRPYLSMVDRLEGEPILFGAQPARNLAQESGISPASQHVDKLRKNKVICVRMLQPEPSSKAALFLNGERVADFGRGEIKLTVYQDDYLEIDATSLSDQAAFIIESADNDFIYPKNGKIIAGKAALIPIGKVNLNP